MNNITFEGYTDELSTLLKQYDVGVVCSKAEGFGLVTIEYLASGLTVVASDTGANPELLENSNNGFLYHLGDIEELSSILEQLYIKKCNGIMNQNRSEKDSIQKYSIENTVENLLKVYSAVTRG